MYNTLLIKVAGLYCIRNSDGQASVFQASGGLEPSIFLDFGLRVGSGMAKFTSGEQIDGYLCTCRYLIWVSSLQFFLDFGLRAGSGHCCL